MNIACASDNYYAQHLGVMLYSLLVNSSYSQKIEIFIADGGISTQNKLKFSILESKFRCKINYILPDKAYFERVKIYENYGLATYYRLYLVDILNVDKLLFLDCDMIVESDIKELYDLDLNNNIIGAVADVFVPEKHIKKLENSSYFNAGMMLIDTQKWKQANISSRCIQFHQDYEYLVEYADQDSLNFVLKNQWESLPLKWNYLSKSVLTKYNLTTTNFQLKNKSELIVYINNPAIIHYANRLLKPWNWVDPSPYKSNYIRYLRLSPWSDSQLQDKTIFGLIRRVYYYFSFILKYLFRTKI